MRYLGVFLDRRRLFLFSARSAGGKERERKKHSRSARALVSMSIASVIIIQRQKRRQRERKSLTTKEYYTSFDASFLRSNIGTLFDETRTVHPKKNGRRGGKTERNLRAPVITTSSSLLLLLLLVLSFPSSSRIGRKRGSKFCCTIRTRSSPSSSESRISITSTMIFSFGEISLSVVRWCLFSRERTQKTTRERETGRERERRRSHSRSLDAFSFLFLVRAQAVKVNSTSSSSSALCGAVFSEGNN